MQLLEAAAFESWPSEISTNVDGWTLRLDRGYTRRANSANATAAAQTLTGLRLETIENQFRQRGLRPAFRLPAFADVAESDALLAQRGYRYGDDCLVMSRALSDTDINTAPAPACAEDEPTWLAAYKAVSGNAGIDQQTHLAILRRIAHPCAWALDSLNAAPRCCGLGVLFDGKLGLFDIATRNDSRREGLAQALCRGILAWGRRRGAHTAYLQVVATNAAAIRLYERLGFRLAYRYWYRLLDA